MNQVKNINTIEYLNIIFRKLELYNVDVSVLKNKLDNYLKEYELGKQGLLNHQWNMAVKMTDISDYELDLFLKLTVLEEELKFHILFLSLMEDSNDLSDEDKVDEVFYRFDNNYYCLIDNFANIELQRKIVNRYNDVLLIKLINDYRRGNFEYIYRYNNINEYSHLKDSLVRYLVKNKIKLEKNIELSDLISIFDEFVNNHRANEEFQIDSLKLLKGICNKYLNKKKIIRLLSKKYYIKDIKEQLSDNDFRNLDFSGIDLSYVYFDGLRVSYSKFKDTNVKINPQTILYKDLSYCNLEGLDFSSADFIGVCIRKANLKDTGARIDLNKIFNLGGLSLQLQNTCLSGCYVLNNIDFDKEGISLAELGNPTLVDSFEIISNLNETEKSGNFSQVSYKDDFRYIYSNDDKLEVKEFKGYVLKDVNDITKRRIKK